MGQNIRSQIVTWSYGPLLVALVIYLLTSLVVFRYYQHQINPDGVVYISVAKSYLCR